MQALRFPVPFGVLCMLLSQLHALGTLYMICSPLHALGSSACFGDPLHALRSPRYLGTPLCASGSPYVLWGATVCFGVLLHAMRSLVFFGAAPHALGSPVFFGIVASPVCFAVLLYTLGSPACCEFPPWRHPDPPLGTPLVSSQGHHLRFTGYHQHQSPAVPQLPTLLPACRDVQRTEWLCLGHQDSPVPAAGCLRGASPRRIFRSAHTASPSPINSAAPFHELGTETLQGFPQRRGLGAAGLQGCRACRWGAGLGLSPEGPVVLHS